MLNVKDQIKANLNYERMEGVNAYWRVLMKVAVGDVMRVTEEK